MTPQERDMIDGLIQRIRTTQVTDKDTEAEQHLQQGLAGYPDALYVLAQTVLVQQYGLTQAQAQIQQLQAALDEAHQHASQGGGSFLSKIFGGGAPSNQPQSTAPASIGQPQQPPYQPVNQPGYPPPGYPQPGYAQPGYGPAYGSGYPPTGYAPGGGSSFLRNAMQTAAGVAAGEFVFQGMESLFHGFGGGYGSRPTEVIENNYYGDGDRPEHHAADTDSGFYNPEHDASRDLSPGQDRSQGFADTSDAGDNNIDDTSDDTNDFADDGSGDFDDGDANSMDDSGSDFGGGDDSGGF